MTVNFLTSKIALGMCRETDLSGGCGNDSPIDFGAEEPPGRRRTQELVFVHYVRSSGWCLGGLRRARRRGGWAGCCLEGRAVPPRPYTGFGWGETDANDAAWARAARISVVSSRGYSDKISASEIPWATIRTISSMGMRVPLITGFPVVTFGFIWMWACHQLEFAI